MVARFLYQAGAMHAAVYCSIIHSNELLHTLSLQTTSLNRAHTQYKQHATHQPRTNTTMAQPYPDYYASIYPTNPPLHASADNDPWTRPQIRDPSNLSQTIWARGYHFIVGQRPLSEKLDAGLRQAILDIVTRMQPPTAISIDYLRLGYEEKRQLNSVIVLI